MRVRHNLQLWEGVLHAGRAVTGWGGAGDKQEERPQGHRGPGSATGGRAGCVGVGGVGCAWCGRSRVQVALLVWRL